MPPLENLPCLRMAIFRFPSKKSFFDEKVKQAGCGPLTHLNSLCIYSLVGSHMDRKSSRVGARQWELISRKAH